MAADPSLLIGLSRVCGYLARISMAHTRLSLSDPAAQTPPLMIRIQHMTGTSYLGISFSQEIPWNPGALKILTYLLVLLSCDRT